MAARQAAKVTSCFEDIGERPIGEGFVKQDNHLEGRLGSCAERQAGDLKNELLLVRFSQVGAG